MPNLRPTCPRKTKNSWSPWSQSSEWKGRRTMEERICGKDEFWAWSGDEGNDELTCVRSDKSDKSSWSAGRRSSLGSWFQRQGDAWRKERLLTFREENEGGRERVTTSEEQVLRWGWTRAVLTCLGALGPPGWWGPYHSYGPRGGIGP